MNKVVVLTILLVIIKNTQIVSHSTWIYFLMMYCLFPQSIFYSHGLSFFLKLYLLFQQLYILGFSTRNKQQTININTNWISKTNPWSCVGQSDRTGRHFISFLQSHYLSFFDYHYLFFLLYYLFFFLSHYLFNSFLNFFSYIHNFITKFLISLMLL